MLLLVVVGILLGVEQTRQVSDIDARGRVPGTTTLRTEDARYAVLLGGRLVSGNLTNDAICDVTLADGSRKRLDASVQAISVDFAAATIGTFQAEAGRTRVSCRWRDNDSIPVRPIFVAREQSTIRTIVYVAIGAAVVFLVLAGVLGMMGIKARSEDLRF